MTYFELPARRRRAPFCASFSPRMKSPRAFSAFGSRRRKGKVKGSRGRFTLHVRDPIYDNFAQRIRLETSSPDLLVAKLGRSRLLEKMQRENNRDTYHFSECTTSARRSSMARFNPSRRASSYHRAIQCFRDDDDDVKTFARSRDSLTRHDEDNPIPKVTHRRVRDVNAMTAALYF